MNCSQIQELLSAYFDGELPVQSRQRVAEHLEAIAREHGGVPELPGDGERNLQSTLRRGWMFGGVDLRATHDGQRRALCGIDGPESRRFMGISLEAGPINAGGDRDRV